MNMNLYHLSQNDNNDYDTFSDMVVAAETEAEARNIHPEGYNFHPRQQFPEWGSDKNLAWGRWGTWAQAPESVEVRLIGVAVDGIVAGTVICKSFRAG